MWEGKWALVTGAGSGIGRATALRLAEAGARLVLVDIDPDRLAQVAAECRETAPVVTAYEVDVASRSAMIELAASVHEATPALDLLVNNAGILSTGGFDDTELEAWERIVQVNVLGPVYGTKLFVPRMVERGSGHVVNVASASGLVGFPTLTAYATTKFALVGLTRSLRGELAGSGVTVSAVCPGLVKTNIMERPELSEREKVRIRALLDKHGMAADKIARAILRSAERNLGVVPVGMQARALAFLAALFPNAIPRWLASLGKKPAKNRTSVG
jgi:short-subunit dehydrogenase